MAKQGISELSVSVIDGNVNFEVKGVVTRNAYIALYSIDGPQEADTYLTYENLNQFKVNFATDDDGNDVLVINGGSWFNYPATGGMHVIIWDSPSEKSDPWGSPTTKPKYVKKYEFHLPTSYLVIPALPLPPPPDTQQYNNEIVLNDYPRADEHHGGHREDAHGQGITSLEVFIDTKNWNVNISGIVARSATLVVYPSWTHYMDDQDGDTLGIGSDGAFNPKSVHAETVPLVSINGTNWWHSHANTSAVFMLRDAKFDPERPIKEPYKRLVFIISPIAGEHKSYY
ncbi:hypothetical protein ACV356_27555 [Pseudomonas aeruginosa]